MKDTLAKWMQPLTAFGAAGRIVVQDGGHMSVRLETPSRRYTIEAVYGDGRSELRVRTADNQPIAVGPFTRETWEFCLARILGFEMSLVAPEPPGDRFPPAAPPA